MRAAILAFIDGTICDDRHRLALYGTPAFLSAENILADAPVPGSVAALRALAARYEIVYIGARPEAARPATLAWLQKHGFPAGRVFLAEEQAERLRLAAPLKSAANVVAGIGDRWDDNELHRAIGCMSIILREYAGDWPAVSRALLPARTARKPERLRKGDTVGLVAPAYAISAETLAPAIRNLEGLGYRVACAPNLCKSGHGYAATVEERAADFNRLAVDRGVKLILFGGGEVCNELLPHLDYAAIGENPKIYLSYSDSTTLLNAITARSGLTTFYGQSPRTFFGDSAYNRRAFGETLTQEKPPLYEKSGPWRTLVGGRAEGVLTGGYLVNYAAMLGGKYLAFAPGERYILFLEENIRFSPPAVVAKWLAHIEQSGMLAQVTGVLFGHYAPGEEPEFEAILARFAARHGLPFARCEDFGHGENNAILPIGSRAVLDADAQTLVFPEGVVR